MEPDRLTYFFERDNKTNRSRYYLHKRGVIHRRDDRIESLMSNMRQPVCVILTVSALLLLPVLLNSEKLVSHVYG